MHLNLLSKNNDTQSTTKYGFLLWPNAQIVALCAHCTRTALKAPPPNTANRTTNFQGRVQEMAKQINLLMRAPLKIRGERPAAMIVKVFERKKRCIGLKLQATQDCSVEHLAVAGRENLESRWYTTTAQDTLSLAICAFVDCRVDNFPHVLRLHYFSRGVRLEKLLATIGN